MVGGKEKASRTVRRWSFMPILRTGKIVSEKLD